MTLNKPDFELTIPGCTSSVTQTGVLLLKFRYCYPDVAPGFEVTTCVDTHGPYTGFISLESVRRSSLSPEGFRSYLIEFVTGDHFIVKHKLEEARDTILVTVTETDILGDIQITLTRPPIDRVTILSGELALASQTISELRHQIAGLESRVEVPGPSFRYDILTGEVRMRHINEECVSDLLFKFIREAGVVERICEENARMTKRSMDEHIEPLKRHTNIWDFRMYLEIKLSLTISIRCIIEALAFYRIVVSEKTRATSVNAGKCSSIFHNQAFAITIPSGLVVSINPCRKPKWGVIDFETVRYARRPRVMSIEHEDITKLQYYCTSPETLVKEFYFGCPGHHDIPSSSSCRPIHCGCGDLNRYVVRITYLIDK